MVHQARPAVTACRKSSKRLARQPPSPRPWRSRDRRRAWFWGPRCSGGRGGQLRERTGALVAQLAPGALAAGPDPVVHRLDLIEQRRVVGDHAELEVAAAAAARA